MNRGNRIPQFCCGRALYRRNASRWFAARLLLTILCASVAGYGSSAESSGGTVLRSIQQVRHLTADALRQTPEVHVRGVVTYYDSVAPNLFVQDASGGIWVDLRGIPGEAPRPGQVLDLHGVAASGFAPYIARPRWTVVGTAPQPKPLRLTYEQASAGIFDSQWVEMEGVVRSFVEEAEGNVLVIDVASPTGDFKVRVPDYRTAFPMQLVDAKVRFYGVCGSAFNRRNQLVAIHIFMPSLADSAVLNPAPADPFSLPATLVGNIRKFSADLSDIRRVKIIGTVTARFPQRGLFLMDSTGGLYVESQDGTPVQPGDEA
jgi:hypothetical protein